MLLIHITISPHPDYIAKESHQNTIQCLIYQLMIVDKAGQKSKSVMQGSKRKSYTCRWMKRYNPVSMNYKGAEKRAWKNGGKGVQHNLIQILDLLQAERSEINKSKLPISLTECFLMKNILDWITEFWISMFMDRISFICFSLGDLMLYAVYTIW